MHNFKGNTIIYKTNRSLQKNAMIDMETLAVGIPEINHVEVQEPNPIISGFQSNINVDLIISHYARIEAPSTHPLTIFEKCSR